MTPNQLREILTQHVLWLDSDGFQGRRANLPGMSLTRADLRGANLAGANLFEAELRGVNLYEANLTRSNLTGAQLGPEIRECWGFPQAQVSEDQLAWLCLHPRFSEWVDGLVIV